MQAEALLQEDRAECVMHVRKKLADAWLAASRDPGWVRLYSMAVDTFDQKKNTDEKKTIESESNQKDVAEEDVADAKQEPLETPKRRKKAINYGMIDLCTPPRVEAVGKQRAAFNQTEAGKEATHKLRGCLQTMVNETSAPPSPSGANHSKRRRLIGKQAAEKVCTDPCPDEKNHEAQDQVVTCPDKPRKTRVKRKEITVDDKKLDIVKEYLASIGVTWSKSQRFHFTNAIGPGAEDCKKQHGFSLMQASLVALKVPECLTCMKNLLHTCGFEMEKLEALLEETEVKEAPSPFTRLKRQLVPTDVEPPSEPPMPIQDAETELEPDKSKKGDVEEPQTQTQKLQQLSRESLDLIQSMKCLEVLPPGFNGKAFPVRCKACRSLKQPAGRIFDLTSTKDKSVEHFVRQHCRGDQHRLSLKLWLAAKGNPSMDKDLAPGPLEDTGLDTGNADASETSSETVPCQGLSLTHDVGATKYARYKNEIKLWSNHSNLATALSKHQYRFDIGKQELVLMHQYCNRLVDIKPNLSQPLPRPVCSKCLTVDQHQNVLRNAIRFSTKHWMARILEARLFKADSVAEDLTDSLKATTLYKCNTKTFDDLLSKSPSCLQSWVRTAFCHMPQKLYNAVLFAFVERVVKPCILVNVQDCNNELRKMASLFSASVQSGDLSEFGSVCARIAKAACEGKFAERPAVMGLLCQCLESVDREARGVYSMSRPRNMSNTEKDLISEAGALLALNNCSASMMKAFGFNKQSTLRAHGKIDNLLATGLPCPPLALLWPDIMEQNCVALDCLIPRPSNLPVRRLAVCFDFTYLTKLHAVTQLHGNKVIIGSPFRMSDLEAGDSGTRCCLGDIPEAENAVYKGEKEKANRMLLGYAWLFRVNFI